MKRIQIIDLVRTLSILLVIGHHLFGVRLSRLGRFSFSLTDLSTNFSNGNYGVTLFFVVSGYLITGLIVSGKYQGYQVNFRDFYAKRIARIFPLLLVIILLGWGIVEFVDFNSWIGQFIFKKPGYPYDFWFWASFPAFLSNWLIAFRGDNQGLYWGVLWSLAVEEQFYLSYPWILKKIKKFRVLSLFLAAVILGGLFYRAILSHFGYGRYSLAVMTSFGSFDQIAMGSLLYFVSEKWKTFLTRHHSFSAMICLCGLALLVFAYINMSPFYPLPMNYGIVWGPFFISLGCALFLLGGLRMSLFESMYLRWLTIPGQLSYGCYLWHSAVLFALWPFLSVSGPLLSFLVLTFAVVLTAYVSYAFIEKPSNRLIRKIFAVKRGKPLSVPGMSES